MKKLTILLLASLFSLTANAAIITYEVKDFQAGSFTNSDYASSWSNNTNLDTDFILSEFTGQHPGKNTLSHLSVVFDLGLVNSIDFHLGLDAHYGAAAYLDGNFLSNKIDNLWWDGNWNNPDVFSTSAGSLANATHTLDLYWGERCCNGLNSGQFSTDGGTTWQTLSVANLNAAAIAEPSIIALFGLGLIGFGFTRRR